MNRLLFVILFLSISLLGFSQKKQINCLGDTVRYLSIGREHKGIGLGNPSSYNGLRLSLIDRNCITNGITFNMFSDVNSRKTNGLDIGISQSAGSVNGVSIGLLGNNIDYELRGFGFGTVLSEGLNIYGVSITGGFQRADKFHGLCFAGLMYRSYETKGFVTSGVFLQNDSIFSGVAVTTLASKISFLRGLTIALTNWSNEVRGVQLGLINKTNYMKGVQFGLINVITENPKWARVFPLINMSFKVKPVSMDLGIENPLAVNPCKNGPLNFQATIKPTINDTLIRDISSLDGLTPDSVILSFEKTFNTSPFQIYLNEKLVFPVKGQTIDSTSHPMENFIKIKLSESNFVKVMNKDQKKCMESEWKLRYAILRFSTPKTNGESYVLMTYTNDFLPPEQK